MKCGLVYLSQESCLVGDVSYHSYEGIVVDAAEKERLARDLGVHNKVSVSLRKPFFVRHRLSASLADVTIKPKKMLARDQHSSLFGSYGGTRGVTDKRAK